MTLAPIDPLDLPAIWREPGPTDPRAVYLASLGPGSQLTMKNALELVAREFGAADARAVPWELLRYAHVAALRARLLEPASGKPRAPSYVNKILAAVKGTLLAAARLGLMSREHMHNATDIKPIAGTRELRGRALSAGELRALFATCADGTILGIRDAAILALGYGCGLRRAEIVSIDLADVVEDSVRVVGKGNRERSVFLPKGTRAALDEWLEVRGHEPGPLLYPVRNGRILPRRCVPDVVIRVLQRRAAAAALRHCSPHDLRRTVTGDLLDAGVDLVSVQGVLGHSQVTTTARYDRRGERARRGAAELVHVPHVGRGEGSR